MEENKQESLEELKKKGFAYYNEGNHEKAKEILVRALEIQTKESIEDDLSVAGALNVIGSVLLKEGKLNEALEKFERVLAIQLKKLGRHVDTAETYEIIGQIYHEQKNDQNCGKMLRKALDIKLEVLPRENISDLTDLYQRLSISLQLQGKFSEATNTNKRALATLLEVHGEEHPAVIESYNGIAILLANQMRFDDAIQILDKSIEICSRLQEAGDFDKDLLARSLFNKGRCLKIQGRLDGATQMFTKALAIRKEALGAMHPSTGEFYESLGETYVRQDMLEEGIHAFTKTLEIRQSVFSDDHPGLEELKRTIAPLKRRKKAKTLHEQGLAMKTQGDWEKARQFFQEALNIYEDLSATVFDASMAAIYANISTLYMELAIVCENISSMKVDNGLLEDGIAASAEALKIRRRIYGDDHRDTKRRMKAHRSLLKRLLQNRGTK
ncbi:unnamed protein product [Cylindrotheca closterium]|uniref:Kinesin light chain n=1 Tax=Cylindrotheca closterium TaxID=2856 RepID=A0AAD2FMD5_9STRA|nr:unnamed protein product [Cylindrotheca closterium]